MQENSKKTILILDLRESDATSSIIAEILENDNDFVPICVHGEQFASLVEQLADEVFNKYIIFKKIKATTTAFAKDVLSILPLPKKEKELSFYKNLPLHKKIRNAILRYNPALVLCLSADALKGACAYREHIKGEFKVGALLDSYCPDKRFAIREADFLIVDNYDIKEQYLSFGVAEEKINIVPIPTSPSLSKLPFREQGLKHFEIDDKPSLFVCATALGDERFKRVVTDIGLGDKLNILISCGQNKKLEKFIHELYKPWIRVVSSEDIPIALGLCDMVVGRPQAEIITQAIFLEKIFFSIFATGGEERHTQDYLGYDIIVPCKDVSELFFNIKKLHEDSTAFSDRLHHIQAIKVVEQVESLKKVFLSVTLQDNNGIKNEEESEY